MNKKKEYKSPKLKKFEIRESSREEGAKQITRRRSLFNIASWFTPVVLSTALPAHARCSGGGDDDDWNGWGHKKGWHKRNWFDDDDCDDWDDDD